MTASQWNVLYPVGTPVRYFPINELKEFSETKTRSEAWELGHGRPVVMVEGKSGGVALDHLVVIEVAK